MKQLRQLHLYLGVFFTPLLLFFIVTGWLQTVSSDRLKSPSEAETLAQKLRVVHTDQIYPETGVLRQKASPKVFKVLVVVMSIALILTTVLGVVLAFRFGRAPIAVGAALGLGILVPVLILWAAPHR